MSNQPPACDADVFRNGVTVMIVDTGESGGNRLLEAWVVKLREAAGCPVDWHYSGGRAQVLTTGNHAEVLALAKSMPPPIDVAGKPMRIQYSEDGLGLFRNIPDARETE